MNKIGAEVEQELCLEPTYEGLKLHCAGVSLGATSRLEPTYEGLKQRGP